MENNTMQCANKENTKSNARQRQSQAAYETDNLIKKSIYGSQRDKLTHKPCELVAITRKDQKLQVVRDYAFQRWYYILL